MLAKLLRRLILLQFALGIGLGFVLRMNWWSMALFGLVLPLATMLVVDTLSALVSRNRDEPALHWWRSLVGEFHAGCVVFLLRQPWTVRSPVLLPAASADNRVPVVLVHGYLCNCRIWDDMADALRAQGHDVFAVNLEPLFCSIDGYAPIIEKAVRELMDHSGSSSVALVGHSMGGLAIRAWMRSHGSQRVSRVITLGTPHSGTKMARAAYTANGKQMVWRGIWLQELARIETETVRALMRIALTPQDNIVFHQREQVLDGIAPAIFEGIGHVQMCLYPAVIAWVQAQLQEVEYVATISESA